MVASPATNAIIGLRGIQVFDCGPKWSYKLENAKTEAVQDGLLLFGVVLKQHALHHDVLALRFASMKAPP